jgi:hypothetical protein
MADYTDLNVYHDVGPVLETTSRVSLPVVGATNRFTTSISRDGDPVNNAVVTLQVFDSNDVLVYPSNNTLLFASITTDEAGRFTGGVYSGPFGNQGSAYVVGDQVTILQELGGAEAFGGSNATIVITGILDASGAVNRSLGAEGSVSSFSIISPGLRYKSGPASTRLTATTVLVQRDLSINGFYSLVPEKTNIFTKAGYQYKIQWFISVPADAKFPVCVYPRTQYVVASDS